MRNKISSLDFTDHEYFKTELGILVLGDARELVKSLQSLSVDSIITDPPWGVGFDEYDDPDVFFDIEEELFRVAKRDSWLVFFYTS